MRRFSAFAVLLLISIVAPSLSLAHQGSEHENGEIVLVGDGSSTPKLVASGSAEDKKDDESPFPFPYPAPEKPVAPPSPHFPPHLPPPSPHFPPHLPPPSPHFPPHLPPPSPHFPPHLPPPSPHFPPHSPPPPPPPPEWPKPGPPPSPHFPPPHFPPPPHHLPKALLAHLDISKGTLSPEFSPEHFNYSASVKSKVKKIEITAVAPKEAEKEYTITVNSIPIKSGVPSPDLRVGKAGKDVLFQISVTAPEHEPSTYFLVVHRGKSKWDKFGYKFLLALGIILLIAVLGLLCYGCYVCWKTGRLQQMWPFKRRESNEYSALSTGPSSRP